MATPRRSTRSKQQPRYSYHISVAMTDDHNPSSVAEAKSAPEAPEWEKAIEREMKSLHLNDVWELVDIPPDRKIVGIANGFSNVRSMPTEL